MVKRVNWFVHIFRQEEDITTNKTWNNKKTPKEINPIKEIQIWDLVVCIQRFKINN